ncbi:hypothetical protein ACMZOO_03135 [Catenovulum sp. SX2]|uniref:hypothetical protein n=1 Tax=Catenovulum sp. SX2 TaxID=3398614 RepID=UPI003F86C325
MNKKSKLEKYVELFNRKIASYLSNHISIKTIVHPVVGEGAVFELLLNPDNDQSVTFKPPQKTVGYVLTSIPQKLFEGNPERVKFQGTSLYLENNRIVVIKGGDSANEWTGPAILNDVERVLSTSQGAK